jgi:hypothetical protein
MNYSHSKPGPKTRLTAPMKTTIVLEQRQSNWLSGEAEKQNTSVSEIVRRLIDEHTKLSDGESQNGGGEV